MKKAIILLLLVSVLFIGKNVYAEDPDVYTAGDYKYTIEKFTLRMYRVENDESGETTDETFGNFQANRFDKEIEIPIEDITFEPSSEEVTMNETKAQLAKLNAVFDEEKIKALLSEEIAATDDSNHYIGEIVVYYKVTEAPEKFTKFFSAQFYKEFLKSFLGAFGFGEECNFESNIKEVTLTDTLTQPVQYLTIINKEFELYSKAADTEPPLLLFNYLQFSDENYDDSENPTDILMFTNVSDTEYLIDTIGEFLSSDPYDEEMDFDDIDIPGGNINAPTKEPIPDTAMNKEIIVIIAGIIMIMLGSGIALKTVIKNN